MVKVLHEAFGVQHGFMSTVHAYTGDQNLLDAPHKDVRRARSAAVNIIPTTTGAAKAVGEVLPELAGRLDGVALRVPVVDGSLVDLAVLLDREVTVAEVNAAFEAAATTPALRGRLRYEDGRSSRSTSIGDPASCVFDSSLTQAAGSFVKVFGWYDNEWGYTARLLELTRLVGTLRDRDPVRAMKLRCASTAVAAKGVVTAAELLSMAAFDQGLHAQALPSFGSERTGAPVMASCRICDRPDPVARPDEPPRHAGGAGPRPCCATAPSSPACRRTASSWSTPTATWPISSTGGWSPVRSAVGDRSRERPGPSSCSDDHSPTPRSSAPSRGSRTCWGRKPSPVRSAVDSAARARGSATRTSELAEEARHLVDESHGAEGAKPMLRQLEGSRAVAETVARCRPHVVAAYPISPQTHIVEALSELVGRRGAGAV